MMVMTNGSLVEILNTHDNIYNITKNIPYYNFKD
jgi:hypothetical protein